MSLWKIKNKILVLAFSLPLCALAQEEYKMEHWKSGVSIDSRSSALNREKVLFKNPGSEMVTPVVLLTYNESPEQVARVLKDEFLNKSKINLNEKRTTNEDFKEILTYTKYRYYGNLDKYQLMSIRDAMFDLEDKLSQVDIKINNLNEIKLSSGAIDKNPKFNSFTQYLIYIYDASQVMNEKGSVVLITRMDEYSEWGWWTRHDPFSFWKHRYSTNFIDPTLKNNVIENSTIKYKSVVVLPSEFFVDRDVNKVLWFKLKKSLSTAK